MTMDGQEVNLWPYILAAVLLAGVGLPVIGLLLQAVGNSMGRGGASDANTE